MEFWKMKLLFATILSAVLSQGHCQTTNGYQIKGAIKDIAEGTTFYLICDNRGRPDTIAAQQVKNGSFTFTGVLEKPGQFHWIRPDSSLSGKPLTILLENSTIELKGKKDGWPDDIKIMGSLSHNDYAFFIGKFSKPKEKLHETLAKEESLFKSINYSLENLDSTQKQLYFQKKEEIHSEYADRERIYNKVMTDFVFDYPESYYTPHLVMKIGVLLGEQGMLNAYNKLSDEVKTQSYYGSQLSELMSNKATLRVGQIISDFFVHTPDGQLVSIFDVLSKKKITLISFWASWCGPCRQAMPKIKAIYNQFQDKGFNVLSISTDRDKSSWLKAMEEEDMSWNHGQSIDAVKMFDVRGIPAYVLLDNKGKIIAFHMAVSGVAAGQNEYFMGNNGDKLIEMLDALLKE